MVTSYEIYMRSRENEQISPRLARLGEDTSLPPSVKTTTTCFRHYAAE